MKCAMRLRLLRIFLGLAALTWGAAVFGVFVSWSTAVQGLQGFGAQAIAYDRMLDYWLRMAAGDVGDRHRIGVTLPQIGHLALRSGRERVQQPLGDRLDPRPRR